MKCSIKKLWERNKKKHFQNWIFFCALVFDVSFSLRNKGGGGEAEIKSSKQKFVAEVRARQQPKTLMVSLFLVQKCLGNSWPRKSGMMFVSFLYFWTSLNC